MQVVEEFWTWKGTIVMKQNQWYRAVEDEWDHGRQVVFQLKETLVEDEEYFATGFTTDGRSVMLKLIYWDFKELTELEVALL